MPRFEGRPQYAHAERAEIDRHRDQPGLGGGRIDLQPLDAVVGEQRHPVALREPQPEQRVREPARPRVPLRERHGAVEIAGAGLVREDAGVKPQDVADMRQLMHRTCHCSRPRPRYIMSMTKEQVEEIFDRVQTWPPDRQEDVIEVVK
jgi:hypothetical protein